MPIPASGAINFSDIRTVFGGGAPDGLSEYYKGGGLVTDNATTSGVPTSGAISFSDFRSSSGSSNRNIAFKMRYDTGPDRFSGVGLASSDSVTGTPYSYGANTSSSNPYYYQPVFRAGTGYLTSLSFYVTQNEDTAYTEPFVQFYGGVDSSSVNDLVFQWRAYNNGSTGGGYSYVLQFNSNGSINTSYTNGFSTNSQIIFHVTELTYSNVNSNHRWYRFVARAPATIGKQGNMIDLSSLTAVPQPT